MSISLQYPFFQSLIAIIDLIIIKKGIIISSNRAHDVDLAYKYQDSRAIIGVTHDSQISYMQLTTRKRARNRWKRGFNGLKIQSSVPRRVLHVGLHLISRKK